MTSRYFKRLARPISSVALFENSSGTADSYGIVDFELVPNLLRFSGIKLSTNFDFVVHRHVGRCHLYARMNGTIVRVDHVLYDVDVTISVLVRQISEQTFQYRSIPTFHYRALYVVVFARVMLYTV